MLDRRNRRDRRGALPQHVPVQMLVLSAFIVLGVILGYVFALRSLQGSNGELKRYFDAFLSGSVNKPFSARTLGETLLCYFRAPILAFLLGFASIGVIALPLLCACQGFLLSYSLFCWRCSASGFWRCCCARCCSGTRRLTSPARCCRFRLAAEDGDARSATGARTGTALAFVVCVCCLPLCWSCGSRRSFCCSRRPELF